MNAKSSALLEWAEPAVRQTVERVRTADPLRDDLAFFYWDYTGGIYVVEVSGYVVFAPRTLAELRGFCHMHNGRIEQSLIQ